MQGIIRGLSVAPSWWSRHGDKVLVASFAAAVGVSVWARFRYDRRVREEWARASRALQILEQRQGLAQESLRLGGEVLGTHFTCFASTKCTNIDAGSATRREAVSSMPRELANELS